MWDLDAEAERLNLKLDDLPMDEKGWDRAVNVAYRKAALRAHPDKHPPADRDRAEANFKRLNLSHKILLRVGKAIRDEAESGNAENAIAEQQRMEAEAAREEEARMAARLKSVMSLHGVSAGWTGSHGRLPAMERDHRTRRDLEKQMVGLLARCGEEFKARARRRRRWRLFRRVLAAGLLGAFLWFVRKTSPPDAREELREVAEGLRAAIRFMGRELAAAIGRPEDGDEMADDLELAFLEGRMSVNDAGGLEVLVPDDEEPGMYYKLNMSSNEDGSMAVWTEGADGERLDVDLSGQAYDDDEPTVGLFGLTNEGVGGEVRFEGEEPGAKPEEEKKGGFFGRRERRRR